MVDELTLTELIESLLIYLEKKQGSIFKYGCVNFRYAFARYFYFKAINNPSALLPLIKAAKGWELENHSEALISLHKEVSELDSFKHGLRAVLMSLLALMQLTYLKLSCLAKKSHKLEGNVDDNVIGFFAINGRFVLFYEDILKRFSGYTTLIFSPKSSLVKASSIKIGADIHKLSIPGGRLSDINISVRHPLFSIYIRLLYFYLNIYGGLKRSNASVLVFAEGTSMYDELASQAAKSLHIPTVRVQSGRGGVMHSGYRDMSFNKMLCWGEGFVDHYKKHSPQPIYEVTGSPLIKQLSAFGVKRKGMNFSIGLFTQPVSKHISKENYLALIDLCSQLIKQLPDVSLVVRKHPLDESTLFNEFSKQHATQVSLMPSKDYSLAEVMCKIDCAIGFYSTTLSEAAACDVIPIILKLKSQHSVFPYPEKYGAAITVQSSSEACKLIADIQRKPQQFEQLKKDMNIFSEKFFAPSIEEPLQEIVNSIESIRTHT